MGSINDWFHVSKEEQEKRRKEMGKRVFKFGDEEQRPVVARLLDELYGNTRRFSDQDQLFGYISARNAFAVALEDDVPDALSAATKQLRKIGWRDIERMRTMLALLDLDEKAESLEEYPTADKVRAHAHKIEVVSEQKQKSKQIQIGRFKF